MMMNDKEIRDNCKVFANDIIDSHSGWRESLPDPEDWHSTMEDTSQLATAALLYIAANMPSLNNEKKKSELDKDKCLYCSKGKTVLRSFESKETEEVFTDLVFDPENRTISITNDIAGFIGSIDIEYCLFCGRKL